MDENILDLMHQLADSFAAQNYGHRPKLYVMHPGTYVAYVRAFRQHNMGMVHTGQDEPYGFEGITIRRSYDVSQDKIEVY